MKRVFVSDVHLDEPHSKRYGAFLIFLDQVLQDSKVQELYLMGDIFDLWLGSRNVFFKKHQKVIRKLEDLSQKIKIFYFEGNHDFLIPPDWLKSNFQVFADAQIFDFEGKKVLLCHGDLLNRKDYSYRALRWFFRSAFSRFLIAVLPEKLIYKIGASLSTTDMKASTSGERLESFLTKWKGWIKDTDLTGVDILIAGHFHVRLEEKVGSLQTFNLGSWLEEPYDYLCQNKEGFAFKGVSF